MLRTLLATTALATLLSTGAYAQTQPAPMEPVAPATEAAPPADAAAPADTAEAPEAVAPAEGHLASNIIGETVYNGTADDAEHIGDVNDLVISEEGTVEAVVIGVGGFLGIGEKNVAIALDELKWTERDGDRWLVADTSKEALEQLAAFDATPYEPLAPTAVEPVAQAPAPVDQSAEAPAEPVAPAAPAEQSAEAPAAAEPVAPADQAAEAPADTTVAPDATQTAAIDKSTLTELPAEQIRAEELVGTTVYGADDANVGEIGDVVLATDGKIDAVILDVGGFLGVGEKEVAVGMDNLAFMTDKDGNKYLYTAFTKEQLDAQPTYDESTWAEKRDEQRLIIAQ